MAGNVTVSIPERLYQRALESARRRKRPINAVIEEALEQGLPSEPPLANHSAVDSEDAAIEQEMVAFLSLYPSLRAQYPDQHVAIYNGRLVDHDLDAEALYRRINESFPDQFVWLAPVANEPLPTLHFRSPRLVGSV